MASAVPDLGDMVAGWTVHPYGPRSRWQPRIDRLISQTAAKGWSSSIPIDITEYGHGDRQRRRTWSNNYDWPTNQTYQQAGDAVTLTVSQMLAYAPLGLAPAGLHLLPGPRPAGLRDRPARALLRRHEERRLRQGRPHRRRHRPRRRAPGALTGLTFFSPQPPPSGGGAGVDTTSSVRQAAARRFPGARDRRLAGPRHNT